MERVGQNEVVTEWLAVERDRPHVDQQVDVEQLSPAERHDRLAEFNEAATWVFDDKTWYRTQVTESLLRTACHVWSSLGIPKGSVLDLARQIDEPDPEPPWEQALAKHTEKVEGIKRRTDQLPRPFDGPLVLSCRIWGPPLVVDGNHRATAIALHFLRTGEVVPCDVYVGFQSAFPVTAIDARIQAILFSMRNQ